MNQLSRIAATKRATSTSGFGHLRNTVSARKDRVVARQERLYALITLCEHAKSDKFMWIFASYGQACCARLLEEMELNK
jgi:hypothetical protein